MPAQQKKVLDLLVKVDRAEKHIIDLELEARRFWDVPRPYEIVSEQNWDAGERTYYLRVHKEIPFEICALIGDIAQNLRCALDHLAWHLVQSSPASQKAKETDVYFPIFETESQYSKGKMKKIEGMTQAAKDAIDAVKPYHRTDTGGIGNPNLYWLSRINVQDKHRLLIPVWGSLAGHSITMRKRAEWAPVLQSAFGSSNAEVMMDSLVPDGPLEDGSKLFSIPIAEAVDNMQFKFHIAFGEPAGIRGKQVLFTLKDMHRIVKEIVLDFDQKGLL